MARSVSGRMGTLGRKREYQPSNMMVTQEPLSKRALHGCLSIVTSLIMDGPTSPSGRLQCAGVCTELFLTEPTSLGSAEPFEAPLSSLLLRRALSSFCITLAVFSGAVQWVAIWPFSPHRNSFLGLLQHMVWLPCWALPSHLSFLGLL